MIVNVHAWVELGNIIGMQVVVVGIAPLVAYGVMAGASALSGWLRNRSKSTTSIDPSLQPLQNALLPNIINRIRSPQKLGEEFTTNGIAGINRSFDSAETNLANRLSMRGLSQSPIAGAGEGKLQGQRASSIGEFKAGIPLLEREMQDQDLRLALSMLYGGNRTTVNESGGGAGGALSGLATMLGYLYGMKGQGQPTSLTSNYGA